MVGRIGFRAGGLPIGLLLLGPVLLGGCATSTRIPVPERAAHVQPPALEALPFTVGVHYPGDFKNHAKVPSTKPSWWAYAIDPANLRGLRTVQWEYPFGKNSVALFDACFKSMFERLVAIEAWPPAPQEIRQVSAVMVPKFEATTIEESGFRIISHVRVAYTIGLYTPTGALVKSWTVSSRQRVEGSHQGIGEAIHTAMTDAVAQFALIFLEQKNQISQWLSETAHAPGATP